MKSIRNIMLKSKKLIKILVSICLLVLVFLFLIPVIAEPWMKRKIQAKLNEKFKDYQIEIGKVNFSMISSGLELEKITISSKHQYLDKPDLSGEMAFIKLKRIRLAKALFKKEFVMDEVSVSDFSITGKVPFPKKTKAPTILNSNIHIGTLLFEKIELALSDSLTFRKISVNEGNLKLTNFRAEEKDTLTASLIEKFDFSAGQVSYVSADSMYTSKANGFSYADAPKTLALDDLLIQPNYSEYGFNVRHKYQKDYIEASFKGINIHDFPFEAFVKSESIVSSYIEIGKMDLRVFRDKRKEFEHTKKPSFQKLMYDYTGALSIDSLCVKNGNITYVEHAEKANEPGTISFNELSARIYKITNDTIYKRKNASFELKADALIMGKGRISVLLEAKLFDKNDAFSMEGRLSGLEAKELNPMLEKSAFISATSGKIDTMSFNFIADNTIAKGRMILRYHGLKLAVINKKTDETTAMKEQFLSFVVNKKVLDSNPLPGENIRVGKINYQRDAEKFIFGYWFKSALSGIKSSIEKNTNTEKTMTRTKSFLEKIFTKPANDEKKQ